jgi:hypothetical protein
MGGSPMMRVLTHAWGNHTQPAAASGSSLRPIHYMNTVARSFDAGLSLAALARLGGAVEKALREKDERGGRCSRNPLPVGTTPASSVTGSSRWSPVARTSTRPRRM